MTEQKLAEIIRAQIKIEKTTAEKIEEFEGSVSNLAARLFLAEMRFDTEKHAKILQTMLDLMGQYEPERRSRRFWQIETREYVDALDAKKTLEDHVKVETKMLQNMKAGMKGTDDEALKTLLKYIVEDERKHHKIMETRLEKAFKMVSLP